MRKKILPLFSAVIIACFAYICFAEQVEWKDGGPKYLYIKSGEIPPRHSRSYPYNEQMKCMDCHKYDGIDALHGLCGIEQGGFTGARPAAPYIDACDNRLIENDRRDARAEFGIRGVADP